MTTQAYETQTELGHLSAAISAGATSITLVSGEGSNFDTDLPYDIMIGGDAGEVVSLTAIATDTLTISATAGAWAEGTAVFMIATLSQPRTSGQIALVSDIASAGGGDVSGPGSSIDRAIPSWNGTGGTTLRSNSAPIISSDWRITTLTDPSGAQDAATKAYVDAHDGIAGGSDPQVQWNNAGALDGAARLLIDADGLPTIGELTSTTTPSSPSAGDGLTAWSRIRAGKQTLRLRDAAGVDTGIQPHFALKPLLYAPWGGNNSNADTWGSWTSISSTTGAPTTSATLLGQQRRNRHASGTSANSNLGIRCPQSNVGLFYRSSTAGIGGVHAIVRFAIGVNISNQRFLCGFWGTYGTTLSADPSGFTNVAGFMLDSGQTTMRWGVNDGSGTATTTNLGSSFPLNTNDTDLYELQIYWSPGPSSEIFWSAENITSGVFTEGSSTTDLPAVDTRLQFYLLHALGSTTGTAVRMEIVTAALYTDY